MFLIIFILATTGGTASALISLPTLTSRLAPQIFDRNHQTLGIGNDRLPIATNFPPRTPSSKLRLSSSFIARLVSKREAAQNSSGLRTQMEMTASHDLKKLNELFKYKTREFFKNKTRYNQMKMAEKRWIQNFAYKRKKVGLYRYDEELAKKICALSNAAYQNQNDAVQRDVNIDGLLESLFPKSDWRLGDFHESKCHLTGFHEAFFYSISKANKEMIFTFRGTMSNFQLLRQFFDSLNRKVEFNENNKEELVNKYFLYAHRQLWGCVKDILEKHKDFSVTFHGHSLGGALASLAAVQSVQDKLLDSKNVRHYTFGQPRVGNFAFARHFDKLVPNSFRVINGQDPIPHWPLLGYGSDSAYHHSTEVWYAEGMVDGQYRICNGEPSNEDPECSDQFELNQNPFLMAQFSGHHTENFAWCKEL